MDGRAPPAFFYPEAHEPREGSKEPGGGKGSGRDVLGPVEGWFRELKGEDAICWAFNEVPSRLPTLYWSHSLDDLRFKVRIKIGETTTHALQDYNALALVVSAALGGGANDKSKGKGVDMNKPLDKQFDQVFVPKNEQELQMALNAVLGRS
jgi:hypothetical protein